MKNINTFMLGLLIISFIICCNNKSIKSHNYEDKSDSSNINKSTIIDDSFIVNILDHDLEHLNINSICGGFSTKIDTLKNFHIKYTDSIITYYHNNDTIQIYKSKYSKFFIKISIFSNLLKFYNDSIEIGMSPDFFKRKYPNVKNQNQYTISNLESNIFFKFTFSNNKLIHILYINDFGSTD